MTAALVSEGKDGKRNSTGGTAMMGLVQLFVSLVVLAMGAHMALRPSDYGKGRRRLTVPPVVVRLIGVGIVLLGCALLYQSALFPAGR